MAKHSYKNGKKENIEIRFFASPAGAKKILKAWKADGHRFEPYSFIDIYFKDRGKQAKVRVWRTPHKPKTEIIFFSRKNGVKSESRESAPNRKEAEGRLDALGYDQTVSIEKKKAWLVSKRGAPAFAFELVPGLGWTGELEMPRKERKSISGHIDYLKSLGATGFNTKSLLQLMEERERGKRKPLALKQRTLF